MNSGISFFEGCDQIKVDIDHEFNKYAFFRALSMISEIMGFEVMSIRLFRTSRGYHIEVHIDMILDRTMIILIQALLGSDRWRELYNFRRVRLGRKNWNVLFEIKNGVKRKYEGELLPEYNLLHLAKNFY